jgi:hypothetical protein
LLPEGLGGMDKRSLPVRFSANSRLTGKLRLPMAPIAWSFRNRNPIVHNIIEGTEKS